MRDETHHAECWKAHPACCRARLDEALELLAWVELHAPYGLADDSFGERLRAFLSRCGLPIRFWDTVAGMSRDKASVDGGPVQE